MADGQTENPANDVKAEAPGDVSRRVISVLCMHRSGSSVIAHGLEVLGVSLGESLMPASAGNNDRGFFEDTEIVAFHERVLDHLGRTWDTLEPVAAETLKGPKLSGLRIEAAALLARKLPSAAPFGFKDPRTARLNYLWTCVFEDLSLPAGYVIPIRNPLAVARSLDQREGIPLAKGVHLWTGHMIDAIASTQGCPRVFVSYEEFMQRPSEELARIASALELPSEGITGAVGVDFQNQFLDQGLQHQKVGLDELRRSEFVSASTVDLYAALQAAASADDADRREAALGSFQTLADRFRETIPAAALSDHYERHFRAAQQQADEQAEQTREAVRLVELERAEKNRRVEEISAEHASRIESISAEHADRIENISAELKDVYSAHDQAVAQRDDANTQLHEARLAHGAAMDAMKEQYDQLRYTHDGSLRREGQLHAQLDQTQRAHDTAVAERDEALRQTMSQAEHIAKLQVSVEQSLIDLARVRQSTSWKLTAPLRGLRYLTSFGRLQRGSADAGMPLTAKAWRLFHRAELRTTPQSVED